MPMVTTMARLALVALSGAIPAPLVAGAHLPTILKKTWQKAGLNSTGAASGEPTRLRTLAPSRARLPRPWGQSLAGIRLTGTAPSNMGYTNTSNPMKSGQMPTWPGQPNTGGPTPAVGGYTAQPTPFYNGDLYQPGFETVGACFAMGNPWQPQCLSLVNPGAISMGLAGFQLPAGTTVPTPGTTTTTTPGGFNGGTQTGHHAKGGKIGRELVDVALSPGEGVLVNGQKKQVPGKAKFAGDTEKNDTFRTQLPPGAIVLPRTVNGDREKEARFVAAVKARKSPTEALRRAHG
jgi:hypothetical protein